MAVKIKICGLSREEDIRFANEARPDFIGFVFAESKRRVTPQKAKELRAALAPGIVPVGVFVNAPLETVCSLLNSGVIELAQLHGDESESDIREIQTRTGKPVIKAVKVKTASDVEKAQQTHADYLLFDSGAGSGRQFDWSLLCAGEKPWFLAGGLDAKSAALAAKTLSPFGVDVSSGAETDGVKDREKMIEIVRRVRLACQSETDDSHRI